METILEVFFTFWTVVVGVALTASLVCIPIGIVLGIAWLLGDGE